MPSSYEPGEVGERAAAQGLDAANVTGGMEAWAAAGLPVRHGEAAA